MADADVDAVEALTDLVKALEAADARDQPKPSTVLVHPLVADYLEAIRPVRSYTNRRLKQARRKLIRRARLALLRAGRTAKPTP